MDPKHSHGPDRIDYQETGGDLTQVHASLKREHPEPTAQVTPVPLWLTAVCGAAICWAGAYLGLFHGGFKADVFNENQSSPELLFPRAVKAGTGPAAAAVPDTLAHIGEGVYANCVPCHQKNGNGLAGQFPPLAKSEWVIGGEKRLVAILLKGLGGPVTVEGATFNGAMPAWEKALSDKKIAAVASYVRASFNNTAPEVSEAKVAAARKEFADKTDTWTAAQLEQIPADATLPDAGGSSSAPSSAPAPGGAAPAAPAAANPAGAPAAPTAPAATPAIPANASAPAATPAGAAPAAAPAAAPDPALLTAGKGVYMTICIACHQMTGAGLPPVFPPLIKSPYASGSPERLIAMILKGNVGPMTIDGKPYNNIMPPQEAVLSDEKVAAVATYVRNSFENTGSAITLPQVEAARKKFAERKTGWTQPELDAWQD